MTCHNFRTRLRRRYLEEDIKIDVEEKVKKEEPKPEPKVDSDIKVKKDPDVKVELKTALEVLSDGIETVLISDEEDG